MVKPSQLCLWKFSLSFISIKPFEYIFFSHHFQKMAEDSDDNDKAYFTVEGNFIGMKKGNSSFNKNSDFW